MDPKADYGRPVSGRVARRVKDVLTDVSVTGRFLAWGTDTSDVAAIIETKDGKVVIVYRLDTLQFLDREE